MPVDLTREDAIAWLNGLAAKDRLEPIEIGGLISMALALVDQPTRLAAARAEGYREGVEAAIADAVAVSIRDEVDSYEMRDDGGGGYSPTDDERIMLEDFGAGLVAVFEQRLRALTPPPAEPAGGTAEPADWTVSDTELARDILCYLGIGSDASLEPGDRRRDRIAAMICADRERRIVKPANRITALEAEKVDLRQQVIDLHTAVGRLETPAADCPVWKERAMAAQAKAAALEAENAALREVTAAVAKAVEGLSLGEGEDDRLDWSVILKIGDLRRARAYLAAQTGER